MRRSHLRPHRTSIPGLESEAWATRPIPPPPARKDGLTLISYSTEYLDQMRLAYNGDPVQLSAEQFPKTPTTKKPEDENAAADEQPR